MARPNPRLEASTQQTLALCWLLQDKLMLPCKAIRATKGGDQPQEESIIITIILNRLTRTSSLPRLDKLSELEEIRYR